jgi:hypothetical protein
VPLGPLRGQDAGALEDRFEELLRILSERVNLAEVLDAMTDRFIAERRPPLDGQLAQLEELAVCGSGPSSLAALVCSIVSPCSRTR